jgi:hypothetical protein
MRKSSFIAMLLEGKFQPLKSRFLRLKRHSLDSPYWPRGVEKIGHLGHQVVEVSMISKNATKSTGMVWVSNGIGSVFTCFQGDIHNIQEIYNHPNILIFSPVHHILVSKFLPISTWKPQFWPIRWYPQRRTKLALFTRWTLIEHLWWNYRL